MRKALLFVGSVILITIVYMIISTFSSVFMPAYSQEMKNKIIVAHRGGANLGLENTLSCIQKGIDSGADMIEIDIHLTKDNKVVVCHDKSINRTTNGKGKIKDMTFEEIRLYNIIDENGNVTDQTIPSLEEVMELINGQTQILIEIKKTGNLYVGLEEKTLEIIKKYNAFSWTVVQSFNNSVIEKIHSLDPNIKLEKLLTVRFLGSKYIFDGSFSVLDFEKYSYVQSYNIFYKAASKSFIDLIHKNGKEVKVWTLNKVKDLDVDGIITNSPNIFITQNN